MKKVLAVGIAGKWKFRGKTKKNLIIFTFTNQQRKCSCINILKTVIDSVCLFIPLNYATDSQGLID